MRKLKKDACFVQSGTDTESSAGQSFVLVTRNFLGNRKVYQGLVEDMLSKFKDLGLKNEYQGSLSVQPLRSFFGNFGIQSEGHRVRFHQDIKDMEESSQSRGCPHDGQLLLSLQRDCLAVSHFRKSYKRKFVNIK